jgi:hypothetical protein
LIGITQYQKKWRIRIEEEWEFPDFEAFKSTLDSMVAKKSEFGQLPKP